MKYKKVITAIALCAMATGLAAGVGTKAFFTSSATSKTNEFATGKLILGGYDDKNDETKETFMSLNIQNLKPGLPKEIGHTTLRNVGTLPIKLYRITSSNIVESAPSLDERITVEIYIDNQKAYTGKLSDLRASNGGYFDPIFPVAPKTDHDMAVYVTMDEDAGNGYQGALLTCDLTAYATQTNRPFAGDQNDSHYNLASVSGNPSFTVTAWNDADPNGYVNFQYNWQPSDIQPVSIDDFVDWVLKKFNITLTKDFELYDIEIKHEKGIPDADIGGQHQYDPGVDVDVHWLKYKVKIIWNEETNNWVVSTDGSDFYLDPRNVVFDYANNTIKIKKSAFPANSSDSIDKTGWQGFEVQFKGIQVKGNDPKATEWKYWSLNRTAQ